MRVSHMSMHLQMLEAIGRNQSEIAKLQLQVATGKRLFTPADDPFAAARSLQLDRALEQLGQLQANGDRARQRLSLEDEALSEVVTTLQRVNELAVQGNNDSQTEETRAAIATEVEELLAQLVQLANSSDGEGGHLFSGYRTETEPFVQGAGGVTYLGDQGSRSLQIGPTRQVADGDSGAAVFMFIPNGNGTFATAADLANAGTGIIDAGSVVDPALWDGDSYSIEFTSPTDYEVRDSGGGLVASDTYTPPDGQVVAFRGIEVTLSGEPATGDRFTVVPSTKQDLFTTVANFVAAMRGQQASEADRALLHNQMNSVLADLDQAFGHLAQVRAGVGSRLNAVDSQQSVNDDQALLLQATLSDVEDADLVEAVSQLDLALITLQAAEQAFVAVQRLSLFNFI